MAHWPYNHFHFDEVGSTQDEAFRLIDEGQGLPFLVSADHQTNGRGRLERQWVSERGRSLTMSLGCEMKASRLLGLTLVVGLSVHRVLARENLKIKWPNDLMLADQKVGGILVESRSQGSHAQVVVGIGLNKRTLLQNSYPGLDQNILAEDLAARTLEDFKIFEHLGFGVFASEFENHLWKRFDRVFFEIDGKKQAVLIKGIDPLGRLCIDNGAELKMIDSGELVMEK